MDQHPAGQRIGFDALDTLFAAEHQFQRGRQARSILQFVNVPAFPSGGPGAEHHLDRRGLFPGFCRWRIRGNGGLAVALCLYRQTLHCYQFMGAAHFPQHYFEDGRILW
jgi:hypothetical protein